METILVKTTYWLFKPTAGSGDHYYVRSKSDNARKPNWFIGYKNYYGTISSVVGDLNPETIIQLETEFQEFIKK